MELYSYFRSTAAYRVRITLNYKQLPYDVITVDLLNGEHKKAEYQKINPHMRIPTLIDGDFTLGQSEAILEYLEEKYLENNILPKDIKARAWVRYLSQIIISDLHPLNNSGTLNFLKSDFDFNQEKILHWYHHWLKVSFDVLEKILSTHQECDKFCFGNKVTMADICLIPQIYNANRFAFDMSAYPTLLRINDHCLQLPYFDKARPEHQPDYQ